MTAIFAMILHSKQETIAIARVFGKALILLLFYSFYPKMFKIQEMFHELLNIAICIMSKGNSNQTITFYQRFFSKLRLQNYTYEEFPLTSQINAHTSVLFINLKCYGKRLKKGEIYGLLNVSSVKNSSLSKLRQVVNYDWPPFGPVIL